MTVSSIGSAVKQSGSIGSDFSTCETTTLPNLEKGWITGRCDVVTEDGMKIIQLLLGPRGINKGKGDCGEGFPIAGPTLSNLRIAYPHALEEGEFSVCPCDFRPAFACSNPKHSPCWQIIVDCCYWSYRRLLDRFHAMVDDHC